MHTCRPLHRGSDSSKALLAQGPSSFPLRSRWRSCLSAIRFFSGCTQPSSMLLYPRSTAMKPRSHLSFITIPSFVSGEIMSVMSSVGRRNLGANLERQRGRYWVKSRTACGGMVNTRWTAFLRTVTSEAVEIFLLAAKQSDGQRGPLGLRPLELRKPGAVSI